MISYRRFKEWLVIAFGPGVGFRDWLSIAGGVLSILRSGVDHAEWARRTRICYTCPIFNRKLKTCRPHKGSKLGCGCYVPYSNLVKDHCWGKGHFGQNFGW